MRIFVAGGTGALGRRLIPLLVRSGHQVVATTRTRDRFAAVRALGAEPLAMDGLDRQAVMGAVRSSRPEVVVHQMTDLSHRRNLRRFDEELALTNRLRTEGTQYLVEAARAAGARRLVAQSYVGWTPRREGCGPRTEAEGRDRHPLPSMRQTLEALERLEALVTQLSDLSGAVLRYGPFYGPGTFLAAGGEAVELVRRRRFPLFGAGSSEWSFVHVDDAAEATRTTIEGDQTGLYNVVDDDPAEIAEWLPELARMLEAPAPRRLPGWLGRVLLGEAGMAHMVGGRGWSNEKAKRELDWKPGRPSWRDGFREIALDRVRAAA